MNQTPAWMFYAVNARDQLDNSIQSHKRRGHHYELTLGMTHQRACEEFGYRGSTRDWEFLLLKAKLPGDGRP